MENVWDYPRPPALVPSARRVRIELGGVVVADSTAALRVLETSHPPTLYVPPGDIDAAVAAIESLARFALAVGDDLEAVEINPLIVHERGAGATAVDAVLLRTGQEATHG